MSSGNKAKQRDAFLAALLTAPTIAAAAKIADISESTAHRWIREPDIASAYREARHDGVRHAVALLQRSCGAAVHALLSCLRDDQPPAIRLRAAELVLKYATEAVDRDDLSARVDELEALVEQRHDRRDFYAA